MGVTALHDRLSPGQVVGLDTLVFIYHFEDNRSYAPLTQVVFESIEAGDVESVVSTVTVAEVLTGARKVGNATLVLQYRALFHSFPHLSVVPVDMQVAETAADLRARHNIAMPDALSIASAIVGGAHTFVTNERNLRRVTDLEIILLSDFTER
jgi:predicted nucleic acid-binding protein